MRTPHPTQAPAASLALLCLSLLGACGSATESTPASGPAAAPTEAAPQSAREPLAPAAPPDARARGLRSGPPFRARIELETEGLPEGVAMLDLDGDGLPALLALTKTPAALHVWRSLDVPPKRIELPDYPLGPLPLELGQRRLVALASRASQELLLLDPEARDPLAGATRFALGGTPRAFDAGDLDQDGLPDLVCALREGELVWIGTGGKQQRVELLERQPTTLLVAAGKVIVGSQGCGCLRAYRLIEGRLVPDIGVLQLGGIPRKLLRVASSGGELLLVAGGQRELWWIGASQDDSQWWSAQTSQESDLEVTALEAGAEAIPIDLASFEQAGTKVVRLNHGSQSFELLAADAAQLQPWLAPTYAGQDPWAVCAGDLDGDGCVDLAIANRGASRVSVVYGLPDASFEVGERLPVARGPHSLAVGDWFGDAAPELGVIGALSGTLEVCARGERGYRVVASHDARPAGDLLRAADIDRDGAADLAFLVRDDAGARVRILWGDGHGAHALATPEIAAGVGVGDLLLRDMDGDGRLEMLVVDPDRGELRLFQFEGREARALAVLPLPSVPVAVCALDLDGDGRMELAVALGEPGPRTGFALVSCDPSADAAALRELTYVPTTGFGLDIEAAELDGLAPTELCLLVKPSAQDGPGRLRIFRIEPATLAAQLIADLPTGQRPYALAAGDFDLDGRDDLIVGAQNSHQVNLWRSTTTGLVRQADLGVGRGVLDVAMRDLDGNGRADVVAANNFSNDLYILYAR